jgi:hypothetical protein
MGIFLGVAIALFSAEIASFFIVLSFMVAYVISIGRPIYQSFNWRPRSSSTELAVKSQVSMCIEEKSLFEQYLLFLKKSFKVEEMYLYQQVGYHHY